VEVPRVRILNSESIERRDLAKRNDRQLKVNRFREIVKRRYSPGYGYIATTEGRPDDSKRKERLPIPLRPARSTRLRSSFHLLSTSTLSSCSSSSLPPSSCVLALLLVPFLIRREDSAVDPTILTR
jgi:hypothetical protein